MKIVKTGSYMRPVLLSAAPETQEPQVGSHLSLMCCSLNHASVAYFQRKVLIFSPIYYYWVQSGSHPADCHVPWFISAPKVWTLVKCPCVSACFSWITLHCMGILIWNDQLSTIHLILLFDLIFSAFLYFWSALLFLTRTTTWIQTGLDIKKRQILLWTNQ